MTTLQRYEEIDELLGRLDSIRSRQWLLGLARAAIAVTAVVVVSLVLAAVSCGYWADQPPRWLRWAALVSVVGIWAAAGGVFVVRALLWRQNPMQVARHIEQAMPELRNDLINSVLLARDNLQADPYFVQQAIREAVIGTRAVDFRKSISLRSMKHWGIAAAGAVLLALAFALVQPSAFGRGLKAVFSPGAYVPTAGSIQLVSLDPGDCTRFAGEGVNIVAVIRNDDLRQMKAELHVAGQEAPLVMMPNEINSTFTCPLENLEQNTQYCVKIGDSRWPTDKPWFTINVVKRVDVLGISAAYEYPPYTGMAGKEFKNIDGGLEAPVGSKATVTLRISSPLPQAMLEIQGGDAKPMNRHVDGMVFDAQVPVSADGGYRILLKDNAGNTIQQLPDAGGGKVVADAFGSAGQRRLGGYFSIRAIADNPPEVKFTLPGRDVTVGPGGSLSTRLRIADQYGISGAEIFAAKEGQEPKQLHQYAVAGKKEGEFVHTIKFDGFAEGDVVVYYAVARDNRALPNLGPQQTTSDKYKVTIQDAEKVAAEKSKRFEELRKRLAAILRMQETQRVNTEICWKKHQNVAQIATTAEEIVGVQKNIKADLLDLAEKFPFDQEMVEVQQAVSVLANNDCQLAVDQSQALATLKELAGRTGACGPLAGTQDKIISTLQVLLSIMPSMANKSLATQPSSRPTNLPSDTKDKLADLKKDMEKFIDEQKKLIQASERLNKKPVDQYTADDEKLLKDLQVSQDKWEKFINEKISDLSKMQVQDFSNPLLLKELMEVKSDITMAKDALKQKATEIATAIEDNGIENAKTITTNIEKWLPDTPDRQKWNMEDPAGQSKTEQPDLPKELEDLIGDLLENEEDMFDEMEDMTSKYNQSGDKGIGWGATDGPISNMNAQGVTGNQLPNNNEMSGRSGEGRSGKSSGEFVEDSAEGKGGRRTPTRLTPDPYQKGEVKDKGGDPAGGSTGGGKVNGWGGEGLEGPVPPPPMQEEMKRLGTKQATLLNKAERMRDAFKNDNYANFKFLESITLMNKVQQDLVNFRYQNVLREKDATVAALKQTKLLLGGKIDVTEDSSSSMPKYVRDDITDAMKGKLPSEYNEVLQQYYKRLSEKAK